MKVALFTSAVALLAAPAIASAEADRVGYGEKISRKISQHIQGTHRCQMKMERPRTKVRMLFTKQSVQRRRYVLRKWIERHDYYCDAYRAYRKQRTSYGYGRPPHYSAWMCIHSHEGSWTDPGAPYYGGLQMDWKFMSAYGGHLLHSKGTADSWTPLEQMWVAERAYRTRGFYPWPNTARMCGLI
jgi:hypothetical protein